MPKHATKQESELDVGVERLQQHTASLLHAIRDGHTGAFQQYINALFWEQVPPPDVSHLLAALEAERQDMVTALIAFGVRIKAAEEQEKFKLIGARDSRYHLFIKMLRRAGHPMEGLIDPVWYRAEGEEFKRIAEDFTRAVTRQWKERALPLKYQIDKLPREWVQVLKAFHEKGLKAEIAGGALRDTFIGRKVKDIDIFVDAPAAEIEKSLSSIMDSKLIGKTVQNGYGYVFVSGHEISNSTKPSELKSWIVRAKVSGFEYNIISLPPGIDTGRLADRILARFDIGLCQVSTDWATQSIVMTKAYMDDVLESKITLIRGNPGSPEHLQRIAAKYDTFRLCPEAEKLLGDAKEKTSKKQSLPSGYGRGATGSKA